MIRHGCLFIGRKDPETWVYWYGYFEVSTAQPHPTIQNPSAPSPCVAKGYKGPCPPPLVDRREK